MRWRNCAAVEQEHHGKEQYQSRSEQRQNSDIQRSLAGRAHGGRGRVAQRAALREGAMAEARIANTAVRANFTRIAIDPPETHLLTPGHSQRQSCTQCGLICSSRKASGKKKINIMQMQKIMAGTSHSTSENFSYFRCMKYDMIIAALTSDKTTRTVSITDGLQFLVGQKYFQARDGDQADPDGRFGPYAGSVRFFRMRLCVHRAIFSQRPP